jgi:hypothetical protein
MPSSFLTPKKANFIPSPFFKVGGWEKLSRLGWGLESRIGVGSRNSFGDFIFRYILHFFMLTYLIWHLQRPLYTLFAFFVPLPLEVQHKKA